MRRTSWLLVLAVLLAGGCGVSPAITVIHLAPGDPGEAVNGDTVKWKRGAQETYSGLRAGYYVVRGPDDWRNAWPGGNAPPFPAGLDPARSMLLLAVAENGTTAQLRMERVVETGEVIAIWARETAIGDGCTDKPERPPFDAIVTPRIDKPVKFFITAERGESCGEPPAVTVNCRVNEGATWQPKVSAQPGDTIDCEMSATSRGKYALTDVALTLSELPAGSTAKLAYSKAPVRGTFTADVFGSYGVHGEATDDSGRKTNITAVVEAVPPKTKDVLVQLVWTNFDAADDPDTFPRVKLRALEPIPGTKTNRECSLEAPKPDFCEVKTRSAYTTMKLKASSKRLPIDVLYTDERIEKGPLVCVQLYFDGTRTAETCDRVHRDAAQRWQVGTVDMASGTFYDPSEGVADAGVEGGSSDAGKPKASPKN